ncbi:uncharacterized protein LOC107640825 [Arachis ipaensis]|uniref:uncharacterized protein LOC107640825 n=1 Tax=Arachis ipaensis TaxID=130454 RepID=UPI0007AFDC16|nr:uncharacterized protein LOC107640825 [Arachis ipaensis]
MATRGRGRAHSPESRNEQPADNHVEFMVAMANLANTIEANAATTLQAVQRLGQPAGNGNENGEGNANDNAKENDDNLGGAPMTLETFLKVHLPIFRGSTNLTEADNWFQAMERALQAQHVLNNQYVEFAAYQLAGEVQHWWQAECCLLQLQNADVPWDIFQTAFYKKYFPESTRESKEMELMQLKQGSLSVADYTSKFEELCTFSRVCQGAPETYESWKYIKYQRRLKDNIMTAVAPMEICTFYDLVNQARVVEEYAKTVAASKDTHGGNTSKGRASIFIREVRVSREEDIRFKGKEASERTLRFSFSGCFNCGLPGHITRDCTRGRNPNTSQSQHQGRVFAVNANDASKADPLMRGNCLIGDKVLIALYDTGASHSFISFAKVEELDLKVSELAFDLHIHTPHQTVMTRSGCRQFISEGENGAVIAKGYYLNYNLDQISVVRDFPEVFPEDISEFPPQMEIEFVIELVLGARPMSITPYRMAPIELAELKTQLKELLNKRNATVCGLPLIEQSNCEE